MYFISSRNINEKVDSKKAIINGLASDGGLYVPSSINKIDDIYSLANLSYKDLAYKIISIFFDDLDQTKLKDAINKAYSDNFSSKEVTPLKKVNDKYFLELYHGPTSAFKDVALQFLPRVLSICADEKEIVILSATSGDTGKAALEGFKDVDNTRILILYPYKMVSTIQERQMSTTLGNNTEVLAIKGNFDDCQKLVKDILENNKFEDIHLTSANSINIARLIPQIVYYFKAYFDLLNKNEIKKNELVDFVVPTGNFGDILAGYIAKQLGLPIDKLVCASNENNVLTDFINTGIYNSNRDLINTIAPSIDILVSSNLERLLYLKSNDDKLVKELMDSLKNNKEYKIKNDLLNSIKEDFIGICDNENDSRNIIKKYYESYNYLMDTHTAVAAYASDKYNTNNKQVILSTASPFKFSKDVYYALTNRTLEDNLECMEELSKYTKLNIPYNLANLKNLDVRFKEVINKEYKEIIINKLRGKHV